MVKYNNDMKKFFYRVESGEGVLAVANKFKVAPTRLIKDNNLSEEIERGDMLYIEGGEGTLYTVKPTDTLDKISRRFNVDGQKILLDNAVPYIFFGLTIEILEK